MDYNKVLSQRVKEIKPSGIRKFFDLATEIEGVISLGVGEPDFVTPYLVRDAAIKSLQKGQTQYTSNSGLPELRELIATYLKRFNLSYDHKSEVIVTVGASEAIDIAMRALIDIGDEVLIPEPSYVSYSPCVRLSDGVAVPIPCYEENGFKLTAKVLKSVITKKSKVLIFPYPNNPTGGIMEREHLEEIAKVAIDNNLIVVTDEIYCELTYGGLKHVSIAEIDGMRERTIVINGFSKSFAMTGWRLGYLAAPKELTSQMLKIHQYTIMCAPTMSQYAAVAALKSGFEDDFAVVEDMKTQYDRRRRYLVSALTELGFEVFEPKGAFYIFPSVKKFGLTGDEFAERLLKEQKIAVVPGSAFGEAGKYSLRISYAYSINSLKEAMARITEFMKNFN